MEEKDLIILTEVVQRSKSNTKQIEDIKEDIKEKVDEIKVQIKEIKSEQKSIYDLTSSVKIIAQDMSSIKESVDEVKEGQKTLEVKMDKQITDVKCQIEKVDSKSKVDFIEIIKVKIFPYLFGSGCIYGIIEAIRSFIK